MTVFYGERGQPVATIENDRLFLATGQPHGFLKDGFIFAIQDNFSANRMGAKYNPGDCFGSLLNGVIYDNNGNSLAFSEGCQDGSPTPWPTGHEPVPEDITEGRDIRALPSIERPTFFVKKLPPIAHYSAGEITRRELGNLLGEPISFGETLMKLHEHNLPLPLPRYGRPFNPEGIDALREAVRQARRD